MLADNKTESLPESNGKSLCTDALYHLHRCDRRSYDAQRSSAVEVCKEISTDLLLFER